MKSTKKIFLLSLLTIISSNFSLFGSETNQQLEKPILTFENLRSEQNLMATNWFQTSGEARALYIQGYNIATIKLKEYLKKKSAKPYSIVLDLDETVLDNSSYSAENLKKGISYSSKTWDEWVYMAKAKALPGAKEFLEFANKNKVKIYYISDRKIKHLEATIKNLKDLGLPVQSIDSVLLKGDKDKTKTNRREYVKKHTNLIMLFGDNLSDFEEFSETSINDRNNKVDELHKEFGNKFIIFPNPMYGAFETAIYEGKFGDDKTLIEKRKNALEGYNLDGYNKNSNDNNNDTDNTKNSNNINK